MIKELSGLNTQMVSLVAGYKDEMRKIGIEITWEEARKRVENMTKEERQMLIEDMRKEDLEV